VKSDKSSNFKGKTQSDEAKALISANRGSAVFVYDSQGSFVRSFNSGS
jgi:hypothetical protein